VEQLGIVLCVEQQAIGRIERALGPVRAARHRDVAVRVDHSRDNRRAAGVDDLYVRGIDSGLIL
jgi:hypothetical protein